MILRKLELSGFKSFAKNTALDFPEGIVAIVGPNGTGKSNIVDAIRWVLAEQSFKTLRGKKGEDLIFHGSDGQPALSRARVSLTFNNTKNYTPLDVDEIAISRTVSKKGENNYILNGRRVRLMDLEAFLSSSGIGSGSFRVLSQGMSDMLIALGPDEFREFIEDAAGVTEFQDKRHRSFLKIASTKENLEKVSALLLELSPRVKFLKRETGKLGQREKVKEELLEVTQTLFSYRYNNLSKKEMDLVKKRKSVDIKIVDTGKKIEEIKKDIFSRDGREQSNKAIQIEEKIQKLRTEGYGIKKLILTLEAKLEKEKTVSRFAISPKDLEDEFLKIVKDGESYIKEESSAFKNLKDLVVRLNVLFGKIRGEGSSKEDLKRVSIKLEKAKGESADIEEKLSSLIADREKINKEGRKEKENVFKKEKDFHDRHESLRLLQKEKNDLELEEEKIKLRKEQILHDLSLLGVLTLAEVLAKPSPKNIDEKKLEEKLWSTKNKFDQIGSIDLSVKDEYEGVNKRYEFLEKEKEDLLQTLKKLEGVVDSLDKEIEKRFKETLQNMSERFAEYIKLMFNGGKASLVLTAGLKKDKTEETPESEKKEKSIEIVVSLPGKKIKDLSMLSGGERTLVSIALLFSLVTVRKPPFLVLDEIDAALDETNSERFIRLLNELSKETQFIIITHNRSTMRGAGALYGVSMKGGVSRLLSIRMEAEAKA